MPIVPRYEQQVRLRPAEQAQFNVQANEDTFGANVARAQGRAGQAVGQAMVGLGGAIGQFAQARAYVEDLEATARAKEAENGYAAWEREALYGENGYLTREGRNAVDGRAEFERLAAEKRREFGAGLTGGAANKYMQASEVRLNNILNRTIVHQANERKSWLKQVSADRVSTFMQDALAGFANPAEVDRNIALGQAELRQQAALEGWGAETLALRERQFVSDTTYNVALRMASRDPMAAKAYIEQNSNRLLEDRRMQIESDLEPALIAAEADQNVQTILGGAQTAQPAVRGDAPYRIPAGRDGVVPIEQIMQETIGLNERTDADVISNFISRAAGIKIDPRLTPWCAGFVNAVLGAQGIEGTGSLAARSFLNFGVGTDNPQKGDIVVLRRGNSETQGHVGFFMGYDANGNILVYGGNQSDGINVKPYKADDLLGFRTAGQVTAGVAGMPNYNPASLGSMYEGLLQIADPRVREETRKRLDSYLTIRTKAMQAQVDETMSSVATGVMQDPNMDLMALPIEVQSMLGPGKMTELMNYQNKVREQGEPTTDEQELYRLQTLYADNPAAFGEIDLWQSRDKLSNSDWEKVTGWRQTARSNRGKAVEEGANISQAMSFARTQLEAAGITQTGLSGTRKQQMAAREAQFQTALSRQMDAFVRANQRQPNQMELQGIIDSLLLPVIVQKPGRFFGTNEETVMQFEALGAASQTEASEIVPYGRIPIADRAELEAILSQRLGRKPSEDEVETEYAAYLSSIYNSTGQ